MPKVSGHSDVCNMAAEPLQDQLFISLFYPSYLPTWFASYLDPDHPMFKRSLDPIKLQVENFSDNPSSSKSSPRITVTKSPTSHNTSENITSHLCNNRTTSGISPLLDGLRIESKHGKNASFSSTVSHRMELKNKRVLEETSKFLRHSAGELQALIFKFAFDPRDLCTYRSVDKSGNRYYKRAVGMILNALKSYSSRGLSYSTFLEPLRNCAGDWKYKNHIGTIYGEWTVWLHSKKNSTNLELLPKSAALILGMRRQLVLCGMYQPVQIEGMNVLFYEGTCLVVPRNLKLSQIIDETCDSSNNNSENPGQFLKINAVNDSNNCYHDTSKVDEIKTSASKNYSYSCISVTKTDSDSSIEVCSKSQNILNTGYLKTCPILNSDLTLKYSANVPINAFVDNWGPLSEPAQNFLSEFQIEYIDASVALNNIWPLPDAPKIFNIVKIAEFECPCWMSDLSYGFVFEISGGSELEGIKRQYSNRLSSDSGGGNIIIYGTIDSWLETLVHERLWKFIYIAVEEGNENAIRFLQFYDMQVPQLPFNWDGYFVDINNSRFSAGIHGNFIPKLIMPPKNSFRTLRSNIFNQMMDASIDCHKRRRGDSTGRDLFLPSNRISLKSSPYNDNESESCNALFCGKSDFVLRTPSPWNQRRSKLEEKMGLKKHHNMEILVTSLPTPQTQYNGRFFNTSSEESSKNINPSTPMSKLHRKRRIATSETSFANLFTIRQENHTPEFACRFSNSQDSNKSIILPFRQNELDDYELTGTPVCQKLRRLVDCKDENSYASDLLSHLDDKRSDNTKIGTPTYKNDKETLDEASLNSTAQFSFNTMMNFPFVDESSIKSPSSWILPKVSPMYSKAQELSHNSVFHGENLFTERNIKPNELTMTKFNGETIDRIQKILNEENIFSSGLSPLLERIRLTNYPESANDYSNDKKQFKANEVNRITNDQVADEIMIQPDYDVAMINNKAVSFHSCNQSINNVPYELSNINDSIWIQPDSGLWKENSFPLRDKVIHGTNASTSQVATCHETFQCLNEIPDINCDGSAESISQHTLKLAFRSNKFTSSTKRGKSNHNQTKLTQNNSSSSSNRLPSAKSNGKKIGMWKSFYSSNVPETEMYVSETKRYNLRCRNTPPISASSCLENKYDSEAVKRRSKSLNVKNISNDIDITRTNKNDTKRCSNLGSKSKIIKRKKNAELKHNSDNHVAQAKLNLRCARSQLSKARSGLLIESSNWRLSTGGRGKLRKDLKEAAVHNENNQMPKNNKMGTVSLCGKMTTNTHTAKDADDIAKYHLSHIKIPQGLKVTDNKGMIKSKLGNSSKKHSIGVGIMANKLSNSIVRSCAVHNEESTSKIHYSRSRMVLRKASKQMKPDSLQLGRRDKFPNNEMGTGTGRAKTIGTCKSQVVLQTSEVAKRNRSTLQAGNNITTKLSKISKTNCSKLTLSKRKLERNHL